MSTKLIAIVGGIAVGKTTIGNMILKDINNVHFIEEDVSKNEFLEDFYADMKKWAFHSRISTLAMIASNYDLRNYKDNTIILMDRCLDELITFARLQYKKGNLSDREFKVYNQLYQCIVEFAPKIDGYIYCYCSKDTSLERIKKRDRAFEQGIDEAYIENLNAIYDNWIRSIDEKRVLRVNTDLPINNREIIHFVQKLN